MKLWYLAPASATTPDNGDGWRDDPEWLKALPIGNGAMGAMVFGDVNHERLQLDEESMWSGSPQESDNPDAAKHIAAIRDYLFHGKYKEASALTAATQKCVGAGSGHGNGASVPFGCFQTLGDLWIDFATNSKYSNYRRELDLSTGVARVTYMQDGITFRREYFASNPDHVMVMHLSADRPHSLSMTCRMSRPENYSTFTHDGELMMEGSLPDGKGATRTAYMARLCPMVTGGSITYCDSSLTITAADEVTLLITASTNYELKYPEYSGRDCKRLTEEWISAAKASPYTLLLQRHTSDFESLSQRASLRLGDNLIDTIPTDRRIENMRQGIADNHLYELLFQFGRYLLISSSRPGCLPANLQGIWANKVQTPWNGDYHTDINVEMNYWPAEVTNLSETHLPLFDLIASVATPGARTASIQYGKKGWVIHPITNVWGYTSPGEESSWGMHTGASAWICQHIAEHYRYTGDKDFLKRMYPTLKGAVEFYMDWLVPDPKSGELVSGPAVSPENTFIAPDGSHCQISMGPTHDQQTIWQLFDDFEMASKELEIADDFTSKVSKAKHHLAPTQIGADGRIMEWREAFAETEPGHRHISHLFALYPGSQLLSDANMTEAAKKSIEYRISHGGGHTGWSAAWLVSLYARLKDGNTAKSYIDLVVKKSINPDLFTECPPFQIDADFGTTAGIAEMLLQSYSKDKHGAYILNPLPALPTAWTKSGNFSGLKARGGFEVSASWKDGKIQALAVKSLLGNPFGMTIGGKVLKISRLKAGDTWQWTAK